MDYRSDIAYEAEPHANADHDQALRPLDDLINYVREYTRERPEIVALTCFGIGFVLGWKLKPW
ncbi:MAG TPA: hypothetical protein VKH44_06880 [Pirellulaceae bacterium]|nr:hypothetical protein [Pirellulaceae bacterium]